MKQKEKMAVVLPEDCWELVFRFLLGNPHYLSNLSLVSKKFLAITNRLRSTLRLSTMVVQDFPRILERFPCIKRIEVKELCESDDPEDLLLLVAKSGLNLESLDLSRPIGCFPRQSVRVLGSGMKNLKSLNCYSTPFMEDDDLIAIAQSFPTLEDLDISYPRWRNDSMNDVTGVTDNGILALSLMLKHLQRVNVSGNDDITDKSILALSTNCAFLTEIFLQDCRRITREGIGEALSVNPKLISLCLSLPYVRLPSSKFMVVFLGLKGLSTLSVKNTRISNKMLYSLADGSYPLKNLFLPRCTGYTFAGISYLLRRNLNIEMLNLAAAYFLEDDSVVELSGLLPCVTFIDLSHCENLTDVAFLALARNCSKLNDVIMGGIALWPNRADADLTSDSFSSRIKYLDFSRISFCSGYIAKKIASICPNLKHLRLSSVRYFNYEIKHLQLPALQILDLSSSAIQDEELEIIGDNCPSLLHLNLSNCFDVTGRGVRKIVEKCRQLRTISLTSGTEADYGIVPGMVESSSSLKTIIAPCRVRYTLIQQTIFRVNGRLILKSRSDNRTTNFAPRKFDLFSSSYI